MPVKKTVLTAVAAGLLALVGCSSDANLKTDTPTPAPQDSGVTGPPPKNKGAEKEVGGRAIPGEKKK